MASAIYPLAKVKMLDGTLDLDAANGYYVMMVTSLYTYSAAHEMFSEIITDAHEVVGAGYTADGMELPTNDVTLSGAAAKFDGGDCTWTTASITARAAILYRYRGGNHNLDDLVAYIDFGSDKTSTAADFTIAWHTDGIITLT